MPVSSTSASADAYERARPGYPPEATAHVVARGGIGSGSRVLDLAAGTGKFGRLLTPTGAQVLAVEPLRAMRRTLAGLRPDVAVVGGVAEALGVASGCCDVVTVAQAFHWFDASRAVAEIRRVLRPGGHLFLVWNVRDTCRPWVREFSRLLVECGVEPRSHPFADLDVVRTLRSAGGFDQVRLWSHPWDDRFDGRRLLDWVDSLGLAGELGETRRAAVHRGVDELLLTHPELAGRHCFGFPFTTRVWSCRATAQLPGEAQHQAAGREA